jgi:hypothetical protein
VQVKAVDYGKNDVRAVEDCQAVSATKVDEYLWRAFDGRMEEAEAAFGVRHCAAVSLVPCLRVWDKKLSGIGTPLRHRPAAFVVQHSLRPSGACFVACTVWGSAA